jgi:DNA polymerase-3 subunit gamma/tau
MIAEVGRDDDAPRRDPEEAAMELLQTELGARRIDG